MAMNSLAFAAANALGPVLGGILTQYCGWSWCFFINLFVGTFSLIMCWIKLPITPKFKEDKLDWFGGVIVLTGLAILIFGFTFIPPEKNAMPVGFTATAVGVVLLFTFL